LHRIVLRRQPRFPTGRYRLHDWSDSQDEEEREYEERDYCLYNISSCTGRIADEEVHPVLTLVVKGGCWER
jgi:hypothetical protein